MKDIIMEGFEGLYKCSKEGFIYSVRSKKLLKGRLTTDGYLAVVLCNRGKRKQIAIHILVARCFLENPLGLPMVNHKDEVKTNNHVDNLEWCDNTYNVIYSCGKRYTFKDPEGNPHEVFGLNKFCRENGLQQSAMCHVGQGTRKSHKGWSLA
jgi:hypothetical protein